MSEHDPGAAPADDLGRLPPHGLATYDLSPGQVRALEALIRGASVTAAAEEADVHRSTVHRWRRDDADFQAALNALRQGLQERILDRLLSAADRAADTVAAAVAEGEDVAVAFRLLRGLGLLDGTPPEVGPTAPAVRRLEQAVSRRRLDALLAYLDDAEGGGQEGVLMEVLAAGFDRLLEDGETQASEAELVAALRQKAADAGLLEEPSRENPNAVLGGEG